MKIGSMRSIVTFQRSTDNMNGWEEYFSCHAYINGEKGNEFYIANAGFEAALAVQIHCRYCQELMRITPMRYRAVCSGIVYELISPADDVRSEKKEIIFRARRIYTDD